MFAVFPISLMSCVQKWRPKGETEREKEATTPETPIESGRIGEKEIWKKKSNAVITQPASPT